jgi:hypothetical protein
MTLLGVSSQTKSPKLACVLWTSAASLARPWLKSNPALVVKCKIGQISSTPSPHRRFSGPAVIADTVATTLTSFEITRISFTLYPQLVNTPTIMLDALRRRSASYAASHPPPQPSAAEVALAALPQSKIRPYEVPLADGRCYLAELPSEILTRIFIKLDRASLTKSYRVRR